jgi:1-acyl-sn-glycerol-3-phosphate acyltransferase
MYHFIRFFVRLALRFYCSFIRVNNKDLLKFKGPLILASNHPNSFLDAIILASLFSEPVHFLALGELTDKFLYHRIMEVFNIIPVYRLKDKNENQHLNDKSFSICVDILLKNGIVLIFPEGISENKWQLGPIKKITARIALAAMNHESLHSKLSVLPVGLNYNSFDKSGNTVLIQFDKPILIKEILTGNTEAEKMYSLNILLRERLNEMILQTEKLPAMVQFLISNSLPLYSDQIKNLQYKLSEERNQTIFSKLKKPGYLISSSQTLPGSMLLILLLAIPAIAGWVFHALLYYPLKFIIRRKTSGSVYYDSALFTSLFLAYPVYWICWNIIGFFVFKNTWEHIILLCMPVFAFVTIYWVNRIQKIRNYLVLSPAERILLTDYLRRKF